MPVLAVALSTVMGLALAEVAFRFLLPPVPGNEASVAEYLAAAQRNPGAPRLFPAGYSAVFDIRGLYEGASKVEFTIGQSRFIPPDPASDARYKVLFLGGSVTEGIFLKYHERWPARLNVPGEIAAFNASMSAAGMLSHIPTVQYLSQRGYKFDLVVLATQINDASWSRRLAEIGSKYDVAHYITGAREIYAKEYPREIKVPAASLRTLAWVNHLIRVARLNSSAHLEKASASKDTSKPQSHSLVVDGLLLLQNGSNRLPRAPMKTCLPGTSPEDISKLAFDNWTEIFPEFRREVKQRLGAELLVVSEPAAYAAPSESFLTDLRTFPTCATPDGLRAIDIADIVDMERRRSEFYLEAARMAGAATFDLAAAMEPYSNSPNGGSYFFDGVHPTPKGTQKFAELLRPAIRAALELLGTK